jgi:hypothetical protein
MRKKPACSPRIVNSGAAAIYAAARHAAASPVNVVKSSKYLMHNNILLP